MVNFNSDVHRVTFYFILPMSQKYYIWILFMDKYDIEQVVFYTVETLLTTILESD